MQKQEKLNIYFDENLILLVQSKKKLHQSKIKCAKIGLKEDYTFEVSESFDSFTSKFARTTDIFTQKVLKTFFILIGENSETFLDRANLAEKLNLIPSAENLKNYKLLSNDLAHEYIPTNLIQMYADVLKYTEDLIFSIEQFENNHTTLLEKK